MLLTNMRKYSVRFRSIKKISLTSVSDSAIRSQDKSSKPIFKRSKLGMKRSRRRLTNGWKQVSAECRSTPMPRWYLHCQRGLSPGWRSLQFPCLGEEHKSSSVGKIHTTRASTTRMGARRTSFCTSENISVVSHLLSSPAWLLRRGI